MGTGISWSCCAIGKILDLTPIAYITDDGVVANQLGLGVYIMNTLISTQDLEIAQPKNCHECFSSFVRQRLTRDYLVT